MLAPLCTRRRGSAGNPRPPSTHRDTCQAQNPPRWPSGGVTSDRASKLNATVIGGPGTSRRSRPRRSCSRAHRHRWRTQSCWEGSHANDPAAMPDRNKGRSPQNQGGTHRCHGGIAVTRGSHVEHAPGAGDNPGPAMQDGP
jgi:hypothetical protein